MIHNFSFLWHSESICKNILLSKYPLLCNEAKYYIKVYKMKKLHNISLKKSLSQSFLNDEKVVLDALNAVSITNESMIFEIGCGAGILTSAILETNCKQLVVFEIDEEWSSFVQKKHATDKRLVMVTKNILDVSLQDYLHSSSSWILLANLPYAITFPILHMLQKNRFLLKEGVVMVQKEVANKLLQTRGRGYGYVSLFFSHYFELSLVRYVASSAFYPKPKIDSALVAFKTVKHQEKILKEEEFWKFVKACFSQPRKMLKNSLASYSYTMNEKYAFMLQKRAQEISKQELIEIWHSMQ